MDKGANRTPYGDGCGQEAINFPTTDPKSWPEVKRKYVNLKICCRARKYLSFVWFI
jgi:hypothetical protein